MLNGWKGYHCTEVLFEEQNMTDKKVFSF